MLKQQDISHIPLDPGVYIFRDHRDQILYIGKAKNLHKRVSQYLSPRSVWKQDMLVKANHVDFQITNSEQDALNLEINMIKKYKPPYNRLIKSDSSYVYIKITKEKYPLIYLTRYRVDDGAIYIGPKQFRKDLLDLMGRLRQIYRYRTCKKTQFERGELCSDYMFGICAGRCIYHKIPSDLSKIDTNKYIQKAKALGFKIDI